MVKKKIVEQVKEVLKKKQAEKAIGKEDELSNWDLEKRIIAFEQRLNRIVAALGKSKNVKGM